MGLAKHQLESKRRRRKSVAGEKMIEGHAYRRQQFVPTVPDGSLVAHEFAILNQFMFGYQEGGLRFCPLQDEPKCFIYYKWSRGQFKGHYVVWVYLEGDDLATALAGLLRQVEKCYEGTKKPTKDRGFQ